MKSLKIILLAVLSLMIVMPAFAGEDYYAKYIQTGEYVKYLDKLNVPYVGYNYNKALKVNKPLVLVFASGKDIFSILKFFKVGQTLVENFQNRYNFTIINVDTAGNRSIVRRYNVTKVPALFIVDPKLKKSFTLPEECYTDEKCLTPALTQYMDYRTNMLR